MTDFTSLNAFYLKKKKGNYKILHIFFSASILQHFNIKEILYVCLNTSVPGIFSESGPLIDESLSTCCRR